MTSLCRSAVKLNPDFVIIESHAVTTWYRAIAYTNLNCDHIVEGQGCCEQVNYYIPKDFQITYLDFLGEIDLEIDLEIDFHYMHNVDLGVFGADVVAKCFDSSTD